MRKLLFAALAAVCIVAPRLAAAAPCAPGAGDFLTAPTCTLFDDKLQLRSLPPGANARNYPMAADLNLLKGATLQLRSQVLANTDDILNLSVGTTSIGSASVTATGSSTARIVADRFADVVNVRDYGASPGATAATNDAAFAAAIAAGSSTGQYVFAPAGTYDLSTELALADGTTLIGAGKTKTILRFTHTGNGIVSLHGVNTTTAADVRVEHLWITSNNGSNVGAGFVDVGGTYVDLSGVLISGFRYNVLFDQTEIATIDRSYLALLANGTASVWIVNGPDHTPGVTFTAAPVTGATSGTLTGAWAGTTGVYNLNFVRTSGGASEPHSAVLTNGSAAVTWTGALGADCNAATTAATTGFTNRITITRNQFNSLTTANGYQIIDDGGGVHVIRDNNLQGATAGSVVALRAAHVYPLIFEGNETEAHTTAIDFQDTTLTGTYVGPSVAPVVKGNGMTDLHPTSYHINAAAVDGGEIVSNYFAQAPDAGGNILLGSTAMGVTIDKNVKLVTTAYRQSATCVAGTSTAMRNNRILQPAMTFVASALGAIGAQTVTPATMEAIRIGSRLSVRNEDGTNGEIVTVSAVTATTFTATFASTKAANWVVRGIAPYDQEDGTWTPRLGGSTTDGTHTYSIQTGTYSRRGNLVTLTGRIALSAVDGTLAGQLQIEDLPFANGAGVALANIQGFGGITFAAGYQGMWGIMSANDNVIGLGKSGSGQAITTVTAAADTVAATFAINFTITYITAAE